MEKLHGVHYIALSDEELAIYFTNGHLEVPVVNIKENEYVVFYSDNQPIDKFKYKNGKLEKIPYLKIGSKGNYFKPLNVEQQLYFDLLNDDEIPIKVCIGIAGSGKTRCALKFGFEKLRHEKVNKIMIVRNPVEVGEKIGFFTGDKNQKLSNWNNPAKDNLDDRIETLDELVDKGVIEMEIPSTMQGRDIKNTWIIVDEAQHLTEEQFKMIGERVSCGSQIVFIGDLKQIYNKRFEKNNGLRRVFNLQGEKLFGCVELTEDVRSEVSKLFATKY